MTYAQIIHYIELIGLANRQIKGTFVGDYDRIEDLISGQGSFETPCIWIESPEMTPSGSLDSQTHQWNLAISVLDKGDLQNNEVNQAKYEYTFRIALDVLNRIQRDVSEGYVKFSIIGKKMSSIDNYSANGMVGWRIEMNIDTYSNIPCYNEAAWDESVEVTSELSFNIIPHEGSDVDFVLTNIKELNDLDWFYEWKKITDINPAPEIISNLEEKITAEDFVYVQVTATRGDVTRVASCYISRSEGIMTKKSVPYLFNPKDHN